MGDPLLVDTTDLDFILNEVLGDVPSKPDSSRSPNAGQGDAGESSSTCAFEGAPCPSTPGASTCHGSQTKVPRQPSRSEPLNDSDGVQSIVDEVLALDTTAGPTAAVQGPAKEITLGSSSMMNVVRCRKCDFEVLEFRSYAWAPDVDYMFFRNHYPRKEKLHEKLRLAPTKASFACQCSWAVVGHDGSFQDAGHGHWKK